MKARELRKVLNNTSYIISNHKGYIAIGSRLCHDLFKVNKEDLSIKYTLDPFNEGRPYLESKNNKELLFIWDTLHELVDNKKIHSFINGKDKIVNPLTVYSILNGKVIISYTDEYDWPNVTTNGDIMYNNIYYKNVENAIKKEINNKKSYLELLSEKLKENKKIRTELKKNIHDDTKHIKSLKKLIKEKIITNTLR